MKIKKQGIDKRKKTIRSIMRKIQMIITYTLVTQQVNNSSIFNKLLYVQFL